MLSGGSLAPTLSLSFSLRRSLISDCLYPSLACSLIATSLFNCCLSPHLEPPACWRPWLSGLLQPGLCLEREMMVNIRETPSALAMGVYVTETCSDKTCLSAGFEWTHLKAKSYFTAPLLAVIEFYFIFLLGMYNIY